MSIKTELRQSVITNPRARLLRVDGASTRYRAANAVGRGLG